MNNWTILQKELSTMGILLKDNSICIYENKNSGIDVCLLFYKNKIKDYIDVFRDLWKDICILLQESGSSSLDLDRSKNFIYALRRLEKLIYCFDETKNTNLEIIFEDAFNKDICMFSHRAIEFLPKYSITVDYIYRMIVKNKYKLSLLSCAKLGKQEVNKQKLVKKAYSYDQGVMGPWSRLDLPMKERVWEWNDMESIIEGTERSKQKQRRYRKGLINYNGVQDPEEGQFWVWYEPRNEPFSWYNRKDESPYPSRELLMRG